MSSRAWGLEKVSSHSPSERTSATWASTSGSSASAAATAVSIAVRQGTPSAIAVWRISAASRTAPERGVGRVDDEPDAAARDQVEQRGLAGGRVRLGASLATGSAVEPGGRSPRACPASPRGGSRRGRARRRVVAARPCRDRRSRGARWARGVHPPRWPRRTTRGSGATAGTRPAPRRAFASATRGSAWIPMTSPVDCIDGPTDGSTPRSLVVENAGALTETTAAAGAGRSPSRAPRGVAPRAIRTASSTIGTPVTFDRNGTVREARGLTSIR